MKEHKQPPAHQGKTIIQKKGSDNQRSKQKKFSTYAIIQSQLLNQIREHLDSRCDLRYNEVTENIDIKWHRDNTYRPIEDRSFNSLLLTAKSSGVKISKDILRQFLYSEQVKSVNPIKEAIKTYHANHLNTKGIIKKLTDKVKVNNNDKWEEYFTRWLVGMVANFFVDKRNTNHVCLTLSGDQGKYKSTFLLALIPDEMKDYVYIGKVNPNSKDTLSLLATKLLIIIDDQLQQINKKDENDIKELITKDFVTWRRPFAVFEITRPHRASFGATVNGFEFLNDLTGSRRYLPFEIECIDIEAIKDIRKEKLFAEAYQLYLDGYRYWFDQDEVNQLNDANEKYRISSREYDLLLRFTDFDIRDEFLSTTEILQRLEYNGEVRNLSVKKVGEALKKIGYERVARKIKGNKVWGYEISLNKYNHPDR